MKQKVALVIDWLDTMGGAEEMLLVLSEIYPDAPIYSSVFDKEKMTKFKNKDVRTTYMQKILPKFVRYKHVLWPVLRAHAFRRLDLSQFDLIISVSTAEAKAVKKRPDATHVCYCNTPTRYYWSHYNEFKNSFNFGLLTPIIRPLIPAFVKWMRRWDLEAADRVDHFIANSTAVKDRITKYYNRDSEVIFPPVDVKKFYIDSNQARKSNRRGFIMWGRHVPYKRFDLAIKACNQLKAKLVIVGEGPETENLKNIAGPSVKFAGRVSDKKLAKLASQAEAFLFPGEEDFGIAPVEAMSAGLPVIAYKAGGALDYIKDGQNGLFFEEQTVESLVLAIKDLDLDQFKSKDISLLVNSFNKKEFTKKLAKLTQPF